MKKIFYSLGAVALVATPVIAVVSCGSNGSKKDESKLSFDFNGKAHALQSSIEWYNDFYKGEVNASSVKELDVVLPSQTYNLTMDAAKVDSIKNVGETSVADLSFADWIATTKKLTGSTHQYRYAEDDAVKLGVTTPGHADPAFQQSFIMGIVKELPAGVTMTNFNAQKLSNNIIVTFASGTETDTVDFHLKEARNQAEADAENAKGGSWFYKAYKAVAAPIKKVAGQISKLGDIVAEEGKGTKAEFINALAQPFIEALVEKAAEFIPVYGEIIHIPVVGKHVEDLINSKIVSPIVTKIISTVHN